VSSANKTGVDLLFITLVKSFIYMRKKQGSKDEALWNSPPSSAKVKNGQSYTLLLPLFDFMALTGATLSLPVVPTGLGGNSPLSLTTFWWLP
jgi:hypothetical protein